MATRRQTAGNSGNQDDTEPDQDLGRRLQSSSAGSPAIRHLEESMADIRNRVGRLGRKGGCILFISIFLSFAFYWHLARYVLVTPHSQDPYFLKMETCPACYGNDFCQHFANSEVTFAGVYQYPISHRLDPNRRVFEGRRGRYKGQPVMIKSLASQELLARVQRSLCKYSGLHTDRVCNMRDALWKRLPLGEDTLSVYDMNGVSDMFRCPSQRLVADVKEAFRQREADPPQRLLRNEEMSLLFTAMVNPEPLMLMTFTAERGWPFPRYHGACGRFIVVEHRGKPATDFATAKQSERVLVSKRILELALRLTSSDTGYLLYLHDWDLSNFAVYPDTRTVTLVDLSNVTVVDSHRAKSSLAAPDHHVTRDVNSPDDTKAICQHQLSDWNLLAACEMLRDSLLKDLPADGSLTAELSHCASPEPEASRFQLVKTLIDGMEKLR